VFIEASAAAGPGVRSSRYRPRVRASLASWPDSVSDRDRVIRC
jgi:hypothetical protein